MPIGIDPKVDYAFKRVFGDPRNADLLIHLLNAEKLEADNLPAPLNEAIFQRAAKELVMLTHDEQERMRYEARQMAIRDQISLLEDAKEQGLEQGREQGLLIGRIHVCQRLLNTTALFWRPSTLGDCLGIDPE